MSSHIRFTRQLTVPVKTGLETEGYSLCDCIYNSLQILVPCFRHVHKIIAHCEVRPGNVRSFLRLTCRFRFESRRWELMISYCVSEQIYNAKRSNESSFLLNAHLWSSMYVFFVLLHPSCSSHVTCDVFNDFSFESFRCLGN